MQTVMQKTLESTMYYGTIPALIYKINYPFFITTCNPAAGDEINRHYAASAKRMEIYCRTVLFKQAAGTVRYIHDSRPFNSYTFNSDFKIAYNSGCMTSLYMDAYTYMGGAHGETKRTSDTWDFNTGARLQLSDIYPLTAHNLNNLYTAMEQQAAGRLKSEPGSYFDDYESLLQNSFNPDSYYLQPGRLVIYYQQYDVAPYSTGLPEFYLPYRTGFFLRSF